MSMDERGSSRRMNFLGLHPPLNPSARMSLLRRGAVRSGGLWYLFWKHTSIAPSTFHTCRRSMRKFRGGRMMCGPKAAITSRPKPLRDRSREDTASSRDTLLDYLLCHMGTDQRIRFAFPTSVSLDCDADGLPCGSTCSSWSI